MVPVLCLAALEVGHSKAPWEARLCLSSPAPAGLGSLATALAALLPANQNHKEETMQGMSSPERSKYLGF